MKKKAELVFIPSVGISHIVPTVEFAKRLLAHDDRFSITVLIMPERVSAQTHAFVESSVSPGIKFIYLPPSELPPPPPDTEPGIPFLSLVVENYKTYVKNELTKLINTDKAIPLAALVVDFFTTTMVDIANELSIPSYIYFTSSVAMSGLMLHVPVLHTQITTELKDYSGELLIPSFANPVPPLVLLSTLLNKKSQGYTWTLEIGRRFRQVKGIIVNSPSELESQAVCSFGNANQKLYTVGPLLHLNNNDSIIHNDKETDKESIIVKWLDKQPHSSVIFLCFGTRGTFSAAQIKEIANGLERSGHRFLWSLRQPGKTRSEAPTDYANLEKVLPQGFLQRTKQRGLVCGWVPQVEVLAHVATGGFVSHCGWNSILESMWCGVPILTWPIDAEQKLNAFELVRELGLAVGMREDYDDERLTFMAEEIESGVRRLMDSNGFQVRKNVKEMRQSCRKAMNEGGSSYTSLGCLIEDLMGEGSPDLAQD